MGFAYLTEDASLRFGLWPGGRTSRALVAAPRVSADFDLRASVKAVTAAAADGVPGASCPARGGRIDP